jgi:hypothetical protein
MNIASESMESVMIERYETAFNILLKSFNEKLEIIKYYENQLQEELREKEELLRENNIQKQSIVHMESQIITLNHKILSLQKERCDVARVHIDEKAQILENYDLLHRTHNDLVSKCQTLSESLKSKVLTEKSPVQFSCVLNDPVASLLSDLDYTHRQHTDIVVSENILQSFDMSSDPLILRHMLLNLPKDGCAFENFCCSLFRHLGYRVQHRGMSGDNGIDFDLKSNQKGQTLWKAVGQCKNYPTRKITAMDIREFLGAMWPEQAHCGFYLTTSSFTLNAVETAASLKKQHISVELWDVDEICRRMEPFATELLLELSSFDRVTVSMPSQRQKQEGCHPKYASIVREHITSNADDTLVNEDDIYAGFSRMCLGGDTVDDVNASPSRVVHDLCDSDGGDDSNPTDTPQVDKQPSYGVEEGFLDLEQCGQLSHGLVAHVSVKEDRDMKASPTPSSTRSSIDNSTSTSTSSEYEQDDDELMSMHREKGCGFHHQDDPNQEYGDQNDGDGDDYCDDMCDLIWRDVEGIPPAAGAFEQCVCIENSALNDWDGNDSAVYTAVVKDTLDNIINVQTANNLSSEFLGDLSPSMSSDPLLARISPCYNTDDDESCEGVKTVDDSSCCVLSPRLWERSTSDTSSGSSPVQVHVESVKTTGACKKSEVVACCCKVAISTSTNDACWEKENGNPHNNLPRPQQIMSPAPVWRKGCTDKGEAMPPTPTTPATTHQGSKWPISVTEEEVCVFNELRAVSMVNTPVPLVTPLSQRTLQVIGSARICGSPATGTGSEWTTEEVQYLLEMVERFRENGKTKRISWNAMEKWLQENSQSEGTDTYEFCPIKPIHFSREKLRNKWKNDLCKLFVLNRKEEGLEEENS